jgi:hypothetical protein
LDVLESNPEQHFSALLLSAIVYDNPTVSAANTPLFAGLSQT